MSTRSADRMACDTSVLVPAMIRWHPEHAVCVAALETVTTVPAHVLVECFSVLTRLPAPHRLSARDAAALVGGLPLEPVSLPAADVPALVQRFAERGIRGGSAYDALIAATAVHHECALLTRDRRAAATYDRVDASYHLVGA